QSFTRKRLLRPMPQCALLRGVARECRDFRDGFEIICFSDGRALLEHSQQCCLRRGLQLELQSKTSGTNGFMARAPAEVPTAARWRRRVLAALVCRGCCGFQQRNTNPN